MLGAPAPPRVVQARAPASTLEAFAKVSALEILLANRRLAKCLRHAGIRTVETSADRLAVETVYLGLLRGRGAGQPVAGEQMKSRIESAAGERFRGARDLPVFDTMPPIG